MPAIARRRLDSNAHRSLAMQMSNGRFGSGIVLPGGRHECLLRPEAVVPTPLADGLALAISALVPYRIRSPTGPIGNLVLCRALRWRKSLPTIGTNPRYRHYCESGNAGPAGC